MFKKVKDKNYMGFEDYLGRKMILQEDVFNEYTTGKYITKHQLRHQLFTHIKDVLNSLDKVWYFEHLKGKFQTKYIKFYKDRAICVDTDLIKDGLKIKTWNNMVKNEETTRRSSLIIKKKK